MENTPQNPIVADDAQNTQRLLDIIRETRNISLLEGDTAEDTILRPTGLLLQLPIVADLLLKKGNVREAETLQDILGICTLSKNFGGLALDIKTALSPKDASEILFLVSAWMEALNSVDRSKSPMSSLQFRPEGRRGMTLSEKIFAAHDCAGRGEVKPGDLIVVDVDWVMASEISWHGMEKNYNDLGAPGIFRNDRLWIAGDHVVDPRVNHLPQIKKLIDSSERAKKVFKLVDYQGMNYTIMHTEFFRERAQPGMLIIGSDSHTCSSGALGCLAIGLGVADVTMPLVTGKTWFKVPETVRIRLVGTPSPGIGGKDIILFILKQLKRNTVAAERIVEFTGPGLQHLSCDARFAISNMTTEFGGITGIFVPDQNAYDFVEKRRLAKHKKASRYFQPDEDASYVETYEINLNEVEFSIAVYPSPDDVVPVSEVEGKHLDGCFIGACTTTEEDLILGALVLEQGMKHGLTPVKKGKRKIVPGSMPILHNLRQQGLTEVYERAGFEVGIPGCSYCVGMSADKAGPGEVWLSSQNRNFENRMGKGSIGNLASAATVAASSFDMKITDPRQLLNQIDLDRVRTMQNIKPKNGMINTRESSKPRYVEPAPIETHVNKTAEQVTTMTIESGVTVNATTRRGKIQRLGDFIDTDALAPADSMMNPNTLGEHCLEYTHPDFRRKVKEGLNVVVAGKAFGCGSSRDVAVSALLAAGVICVIAESFAFIYARNQPALGLLGITISDPEFYETAVDGEDISIDVDNTTICVGGKTFTFKLAQMEKELIDAGGISEAFHKFGKLLFDVMCAPKAKALKRDPGDGPSGPTGDLKW